MSRKPFRRGDVDDSGAIDLTDPIFLLQYLFQGGPAPGCFQAADADGSWILDLTDAIRLLGFLFLGNPATLVCPDAGDSDDSGELDITDAVYSLNWQFLGGKEIPAPGPFACGLEEHEARPFQQQFKTDVRFALANQVDYLLFEYVNEADNLGLIGFLGGVEPGHLVVSAIEHAAVMEAARALGRRGWAVDVVPVDRDGLVDPEAYERAFRPDTRLASVMLANNVVGTVQPVAELARIAHDHDVVFHTDAVQAVGSLPVDVAALDVDMLSLSGHKLHGPKGVGALYVRRGTRLSPVLHGGGQERRLRSGTENVPGIVGLGVAMSLAVQEMHERQTRIAALQHDVIVGL